MGVGGNKSLVTFSLLVGWTVKHLGRRRSQKVAKALPGYSYVCEQTTMKCIHREAESDKQESKGSEIRRVFVTTAQQRSLGFNGIA